MKTEQRASDDEKQVNEVVINEENRTGGIVSLAMSLNKIINMLGEQITAGQLTNHEGITMLL